MRFYWLVLAVLGVWRLTHLLQAEDGPWDLVVRLRHRVGDGFWAQLMDCFNCLSLWIAAPFAYFLGEGVGERLLLWPAISGGAMLLQRVTEKRVTENRANEEGASEKDLATPFYYEYEGVDDGMLRRPETKPIPSDRESPAPESSGPEN